MALGYGLDRLGKDPNKSDVVKDVSFQKLANDIRSVSNNTMTASELEDIINTWAEQVVSEDLNLKNISDFDNAMKEQFLQDLGILNEIVKSKGKEIPLQQKELDNLKNLITFELNINGNNKIMNGSQAMNFYRQPGTHPHGNQPKTGETVSGKNGSDKNPREGVLKTWGGGDYEGYSATTKTETSSQNNLIETKDRIPDDVVGYAYQNLYTRTESKNGSDVDTAMGQGQQKSLLRKWIKGKEDNFIDIQELGGDNKHNRPTPQEKQMLRQKFKTPLQILTINEKGLFNRKLKNKLLIEDVWNDLVTSYNTEKGSLGALGSEKMNRTYWESKREGSIEKNKLSMAAKQMAELTSLYVSYRNGALSGTYAERLMHMVDRSLLKEGLYLGSSTEGLITVATLHNENNDNVGTTRLDGDLSLIDKKSKDTQAIKALTALMGGKNESSQELIDYAFDKQFGEQRIKKLFNDAVTGKEDTAKFGKYGPVGTQLYKDIRYGTVNTETAGYLLAEGRALGATPVQVYNIKALSEKTTIDTARRGEVSDATRFVYMLADLDHNGNVGPADHGITSGAQIVNNYRAAVDQMVYTGDGMSQQEAEMKAAMGLCQFIHDAALRKGDFYVSQILNTAASDIQQGTMSVFDIVKKHPAMVVYMQGSLTKVPNLFQAMMTENANMGAYKALETGTAKQTLEEIIASFEGTAAQKEQFRKELSAVVNTQYKTLEQTMTPTEKEYFRFLPQSLLEQHVANTVANALYKGNAVKLSGNVSGNLGIGTAIEIVKGLQLNLSSAIGPNGLMPGIGIGLSDSIGKVDIGSNLNFTVVGPAFSTAVGTSWKGKFDANTLKSRASKQHAIVGHAGVSALGWSGGVSYQQKKEYQKGIEQTSDNIQKEVTKLVTDLKNDKEFLPLLQTIHNNANAKNPYQNSELFAAQDKFKELLHKRVTTLYPDGTAGELKAATDNIYQAFIDTHYNFGPDDDKKVAQYFARGWQEHAVNKLRGKTKITGRGVGLHVFSFGPIIGVLPFSLSVATFNKGYKHSETFDSTLQSLSAQFEGLGNREVKMGLDQNVAYINARIKAARGLMPGSPSYETPDEKIERFLIHRDEGFLVIPKDLYESDTFNVKISPSMRGKIATNDNGDIVMPVDVPMRISSHFGQQGGTYVLNIGSTITSLNDVHLLRGRGGEFTAYNPETKTGWYVEDKDQLQVKTKEVFNSDALKNNLSDQLGVEIESIDLAARTMTVNGTTIPLDGGKIGEWTLHYDQQNHNISITKIDEQGNPIVIEENTVNYIRQYTYTSAVDGMIAELDTQRSSLQQLESQSEFKNFIGHNVNKQYGEAFRSLEKLNPKLMKQWFGEISDDVSKSEISAYMLQLFALENSEYARGKTALQIMRSRDGTARVGSLPAYARVPGSNGIDKFLDRSTFEDIYKNINATINTSKDSAPVENLIGYTAFYRKDAKQNQRGYAMTLPGKTRVFGGKVNEFAPGKQDTAKQWIIDHIRNDETFAQSSILKALQKALPSDIVDGLTKTDVVTLLQQGYIKKSDGRVIRVNAVPVFYLLAECANESVGLQIKSITCTAPGEIIDGQPTTQTITVDGNLTQYQGGSRVVNVHNTQSVASIGHGREIGIAAAVGAKLGDYRKKTRSGLDGGSNPVGNPDDGSDNPGNSNPVGNPDDGSDNSNGSAD